MGDRGNIKVGKVFLYTHWGGSEIKQILQKALAKKWRWDDEPYLTRIIFCELVKGYEYEETGFGISTHICDNEYNILEVDCKKQKVREISYDWKKSKLGKTITEWSFEEFIKIKEFKEEEEK